MNDLSLTEAADALARGETSSVHLTQTAIARANDSGGKLNCIARLDADDALRAAEQADRERKQGSARGALHGVPLAHKDLFYRKGKVVACGSKIRRDFVPATTATVLERLDAAGAVDIGSLHMAEFAFSPTGYNEHYGHCRNPWNPARSAPIPAARCATRRRCAALRDSSPPSRASAEPA
jgi:aspartyl-tRNA(Asn)/glutamyl-tRNA(Gln) amidotransferase subunit A